MLGVVNSKEVCLIKSFSTDFTTKATDLPSIFILASIWKCKAALKSEAPKSTLLYQSCSIGVVNSKKFFSCKAVLDSPMVQ